MTDAKRKLTWRKVQLGTVLSIGMGAATCLAGLWATPVNAQTMDYGSLEKLFGEAVTTSATGSPQRASDVPANMEIITADDIRRSGADNIPDILQFVAGVDVRRYGISQAEVSIRGYNQPGSPRLLVLVNGRQVYLDDYGRISWESLPVQIGEIRQIEVVKGPNSALFGFNAVGGVINIITYDPMLDSANTVTVRAGTQHQAGGSVIVTLHDGDKAGLRLSAGGSRSDEFSTASLPPGLGPYNQRPYQFAFGAAGTLKLTDKVVLSAEASMTEARYLDVLPTPVLVDDFYRTNSLKIGLAADTRFGLLDITAYRNELNFNARTFGQQFPESNSVYVTRISDLFKLGADHTLLFGLEYRDNFISGVNYGGKIGYDVYAANVMWNWQISPKLTLTNAVRFDYLTLHFAGTLAAGSKFTLKDYNSASLSEPSINSGLVYKPTDDDTFRLLVSRGIQAPSLTDFGLQLSNAVAGVPFTFAGNPSLKAASVANVEFDYDRAIAPINASLRTAVYYQKTDDLLTSSINAPLVLGAGGLSSYSQNIGSSSAAGGEISLKGAGDTGLRWKISYALISITDRISLGPLIGPASVFDFRRGAPASVVELGAGYSWDRIEIDAQARWQSHFTDYYPSVTGAIVPFQISDYVTLNARIGYRITQGLTLALAGGQLGQSKIFEAAGMPVERRVTINLTNSW
jgi:outer membrane receptor for ferrienterochelin and colicins